MTVYNMNLTDPLHPVSTFVVNPYTANGVRFPTSSLLEPGASSSRTSLLWYGKGSPNYGERIQENIIHLLENFAGASEPVRSLAGQLWFQRHLFFHNSADPALGWYVWEDNAAGSPVAGQWVSISPVTVTGTEPVINAGGAANQYYLNNSTTPAVLYQGINVPGHPLNNQWIARVYMEDVTIPDPNAAELTPHQQMMVQTMGRNGSVDPTNWVSVGNPIASPIAPNADTPGTLWYDTSAGSPFDWSLKVYNGTSFDEVVGNFVLKDGDTMTGTLQLPPSAVEAGLRVPHGATPSAQADGDIWTTTAGIFARVDGVDYQLNSVAGGFLDELSDVTVAAPTEGQYLRYDTSGSPPLNQWVNTGLLFTDIIDIATSATEVDYLVGVTSAIQGQLDGKLDLIGGTLSGTLFMSNNQIRNVGAPTVATDAATKNYVDTTQKFVNFGSFDGFSGELILTLTDFTTVNVPGFLSLQLPYETEPNELLSAIPRPPENVVDAVHALDAVARRRTTFSRQVEVGTAATTYTVPTYQVGSNKLFVFVSGLKQIASTQGFQRVLFPLIPFGSPNEDTDPDQLDCLILVGEPGLPLIGSPPAIYGFEVEVDGGAAQQIYIDPTLVDENYTFCNLVSDINSQLVGAYAVLEDTAIVIYSDTHGTGSSILITDGIAGSPSVYLPLLAELNYYGSIQAASDGVTYSYNEVGNYGEISNTIEFNGGSPSTVDGDTIEFIVCGQTGIPI